LFSSVAESLCLPTNPPPTLITTSAPTQLSKKHCCGVPAAAGTVLSSAPKTPMAHRSCLQTPVDPLSLRWVSCGCRCPFAECGVALIRTLPFFLPRFPNCILVSTVTSALSSHLTVLSSVRTRAGLIHAEPPYRHSPPHRTAALVLCCPQTQTRTVSWIHHSPSPPLEGLSGILLSGHSIA
jgi:hypothetical protein